MKDKAVLYVILHLIPFTCIISTMLACAIYTIKSSTNSVLLHMYPQIFTANIKKCNKQCNKKCKYNRIILSGVYVLIGLTIPLFSFYQTRQKILFFLLCRILLAVVMLRRVN